MRYFLKLGHPAKARILLVESGSRRLIESLIPYFRQTYGEDVQMDLVTCYGGLPAGLAPEATRVFRVWEYQGSAARKRLYRLLSSHGYTIAAIICSGEPIMTKWKWALVARLPVKVLVLNENADFFWLDRSNWRIMRHFLMYRAGLSGSGAVRTIARLAAFPFTLLYLLLFAAGVHLRRKVLR